MAIAPYLKTRPTKDGQPTQKTFSGPRSRPSGLRYGLSGTGAGAGGKIQVLNLYLNPYLNT